MAAAPATKGFSSPISIQGSSPAKDPDFETYAQQSTPEVVTPVFEGPKTFKFPLDDVSAGNFWTRLTVNSWVPVPPRKEELVAKQGHQLTRYHIANIWLPMPLNLATTYKQNFSQQDHISVNRGTGMDLTTMKKSMDTFWGQAEAVTQQALSETNEFVATLANINNSGKMAFGSVANQQLGLVYDGASLRPHSLSWKMTPKSREEQTKIAQIVFALKKFSAPIIMGKAGEEVTQYTSAGELDAAAKMADSLWEKFVAYLGTPAGLVAETVEAEAERERKRIADEAMRSRHADAHGLDDNGTGGIMKNIGRLGIPATISVEFWYGDAVNPNLFQIKDSFIESVDVNYTPSGGWNAYKDGAPIETQLSISLKETGILSQKDIHVLGGY